MFDHVMNTWHGGDEAAVLGLSGEIGEFIDTVKKSRYKPGYEVSKDRFADELGDIGYYLGVCARFIFDKGGHDFLKEVVNKEWDRDYDEHVLFTLAMMQQQASSLMLTVAVHGSLKMFKSRHSLESLTKDWVRLIKKWTSLSPAEIMRRNNKKLSDGKHGWPDHTAE